MLKTTNSFGVYRRESRNSCKQVIYYYHYFTKSDAAVPHSTSELNPLPVFAN
jgi:hypothetical protein